MDYTSLSNQVRVIHVAPYTRDPLLFSRLCTAEPIRKGFKYMGYEGGEQNGWPVPSAQSLVDILNRNNQTPASEGKPLKKNVSSPHTRRFWRGGLEATIEVASWPAWKRGNDPDDQDPALIAIRLKHVRKELLVYDAMDYWSRQQCTDNLQYRPHMNEKGSNLVMPSCNWGLGCTTCWERYERAYEKMTEKWSD